MSFAQDIGTWVAIGFFLLVLAAVAMLTVVLIWLMRD